MLDFTSQKPLIIIFNEGRNVSFYEHPVYGDEAPMVAVHSEGGYQQTDTEAWDLSTARLYCGLDV